MQGVNGVVGSKVGEWHARFKVVEGAIARGFYFQNDPSREGYGWWCNQFRGIRAVGPSVDRYEGARAVIAAAKEGDYGQSSV